MTVALIIGAAVIVGLLIWLWVIRDPIEIVEASETDLLPGERRE